MIFNTEQQQAIAHTTGPALVIAGPGSGKTAVVTQRIYSLITDHNAEPSSILTMTFSKAAAEEMEQRFRSIAPECETYPVFGTFHSIFYRLLKRYRGTGACRIIKESEIIPMLQAEWSAQNILPDQSARRIADIRDEISRAKNAGVAPEEYQPCNFSKDAFETYYQKYQHTLAALCAWDFDDILIHTRSLLREKPCVLQELQETWRYIQVDEFQDVNMLQYEILRLLAGSQKNIFAVGDDDQSIYGFRGACPSVMHRFQTDFPSCKTLLLRMNYRCPKEVLLPAARLISHNKVRFPKTMEQEGKHPHASFLLQAFEDLREQYVSMAGTMRQHHESGISWNQMAVLLRSRQHLDYMIRLFSEHRIPCAPDEKSQVLTRHFLWNDLLSYLKTASGRGSLSDMIRILEHPARGISRFSLPPEQDMQGTSSLLSRMQRFYTGHPAVQTRILKLEQDLNRLSEMTPYAAVMYILYVMDYDAFLHHYAQSQREDLAYLYSIRDQFLSCAKQYRTLPRFLEAAPYFGTTDPQLQKSCMPDETIRILTLHAAKGLSFPVVFIPDLNKGILPLGNDHAEERRLLYVGMTRSSGTLQLSYVRNMQGKPVAPSPFLYEISGSFYKYN